jgi:hypothetical protein
MELIMPVLLTFDIPVSREVVKAVGDEMRVHDDPPDGLIAHVLTETPDGCHVVDIWDSGEHFQRFRDARLLPAMGKVMAAQGIAAPDGPLEPEITPAYDLVRGR